MKIKELREKELGELFSERDKTLKQRMKIRFLKASDEGYKSHKIKEYKRTVARILTVIGEKKKKG